MGLDALARLSEEEGKCWSFGESRRVVPAEVAREVVSAIQAERDDLAARLAELEGQEPVAWVYDWQAPEGLIKGWVETNRDAIPEDATNIRPLYARPVPAEPVNVEFGMRGETMFFKIGNQSFLLDYKPAEPGEFEFMQKMLLSAFSSITPCVKTASEPVNARLLEALIQCRDRFLFYVEHHLANGAAVKAAENDRFVTLANQAIAAAEAQQAGPVRPKVSFIPSVENMPMARSIDDEMMDLVDRLGALEPVDPRAWKHLLVYAPKTDPVRLTRVDIEKAFAQAGLKPEDYREDGEILPLVIAIESAALRKNGIEVAE